VLARPVQNDAAVVPGVVRVRIDVEVVVVALNALCVLADAVVAVAQLVPRFGMLRIDLGAPLEHHNCFFSALLSLERDTQIEECLLVHRIEQKDRLVGADCFFRTVQRVECDCPVDCRLDVRRIQFERTLVGDQGFIVAGEVVQQHAATHPCVGGERTGTEDPVHHCKSRVEPTVLEVMGRDVLQRIRVQIHFAAMLLVTGHQFLKPVGVRQIFVVVKSEIEHLLRFLCTT